MGYSFWLKARVLLYAPSHRQDNTYHGLCYTSRGTLARTRNSSMGPPHEGSIQRPIAPWVNALTTELHLAPLTVTISRKEKQIWQIKKSRIAENSHQWYTDAPWPVPVRAPGPAHRWSWCWVPARAWSAACPALRSDWPAPPRTPSTPRTSCPLGGTAPRTQPGCSPTGAGSIPALAACSVTPSGSQLRCSFCQIWASFLRPLEGKTVKKENTILVFLIILFLCYTK